MAYQHYWSNIAHIPEATFALIVSDFKRCLAPLESMGVVLANGGGEGSPEIGPELVRFNGPVHCGHAQNEAILCPIPSDDAVGVGSSLDAIVKRHGEHPMPGKPDWHLGVVLRHRCCNGSCHYETFEVARDRPDEDYYPPEDWWPVRDEALFHDHDPNWTGGSCKSGFRPYDLAVQCFLVIAKHHLRDDFMVRSDGGDFLWHDAYDLCHEILGYPRREFQIVELPGDISNMFLTGEVPITLDSQEPGLP